MPLTTIKLGDIGVHLGGAAAFVLLGLGVTSRGRARAAVWWIVWLAALALVAASSRGGLLAVIAALGCAAIAGGPQARRTLVRVAGAAVIVVAIALTYPAPAGQAMETDSGRVVSPSQMVANVTSIFGDIGYGRGGGRYVSLDDTKTWRLEWWGDIVQYTVGGEYFWAGKGYGVNLADEDGFQGDAAVPLRSPHNIHLSVLARSGVPGLLLWIGVNVLFAAAMLQGRARARAAGQEQWARLSAWLLAYWAAILVNATFDVYIEGPAGGIWFWALIGFGIAALEIQRYTTPAPAGARPALSFEAAS